MPLYEVISPYEVVESRFPALTIDADGFTFNGETYFFQVDGETVAHVAARRVLAVVETACLVDSDADD